MRLALPSLILFSYLVSSLILFVPCRPLIKVVAAVVLLAVCLKFVIYEQIGGSFIAPQLPRPLLLTLEVLYGSALILAFLLVVKDSLALLLWLSRWLGSSWHFPVSPAALSGGLTLAAFTLGLFATWQALRVPGVRTVEITVPRLPESLDGFAIVQLSDLHIGAFLGAKWLRGVVQKTNDLAPDLVAVTGDMIDGSPKALQADIAPLGELRARYGVYGITGNHEYYFRVNSWLPVFAGLGVTMLENEHCILTAADGARLVIAGVPDLAGRHFGRPGPDIEAALAGAPDTARVLMAHRPNGLPSRIDADLQLSGHTHGGHLFFLQWLISTFNGGLVRGLYETNGRSLYVSPGTGIWAGFSCRLGVPAEISRLVLRSTKKNGQDIPPIASHP